MSGLPERIGDYRVEALLGIGGMATVYRARHVHLDSVRAIKVLDARYRASPEARRRFLDEAKIQHTHLLHPGIVRVETIIATPEHAAIVMELIEGPNLDDCLADLGARPDEARRIMLGVLAAIGHAHAVGIVHRDLKPANILLHSERGQWVPKVTDFGVAKLSAELAPGKKSTQAERRMGTLHYMSPEQIRQGAGAASPRSDIFALGAVLYELLTGQMAFPGELDYQVMNRIVAGDYRPPESVKPGLDPRLSAVICRALDAEPARRFASCEEMAAALRASVVRSRPSVSLPATVPVSAPSQPAPTTSQVFVRPARAGGLHRAAVMGLSAAAVVLSIAVVVMLARLMRDGSGADAVRRASSSPTTQTPEGAGPIVAMSAQPAPPPVIAVAPAPTTAPSVSRQERGAASRPRARERTRVLEVDPEQVLPPTAPQVSSSASSGGGCIDEVACLLADPKPACCLKRARQTPSPSASAPIEEAPEIPFALSKSDISTGIARVRSRVDACAASSSANGIVKVSVRVAPSGSVSSATIVESPDDALGRCVAAALQWATFVGTEQGGSFTYPFKF